MVTERTGSKARVFDADDTLLEREGSARIVGLIVGRIHPQHLPNLTLEDIAKLDINHGRVDGHVKGIKEQLALDWHAKRRVYPGVKEELERLVAEGVDVYGNTGRPNTGDWFDMTHASFDKQGIGGFFTDIAFTPKGIRTAVSKVHRLHQLSQLYEEVEYDEDDPRTISYVAFRLPNVKINYIQYGTSGLLVARQELEAFPNVRRVAVFGKRK